MEGFGAVELAKFVAMTSPASGAPHDIKANKLTTI
jgi:hypothetical protein